MRRLILLVALAAFALWRNRKLTAHDREHGFGPYADVAPVVDP